MCHQCEPMFSLLTACNLKPLIDYTMTQYCNQNLTSKPHPIILKTIQWMLKQCKDWHIPSIRSSFVHNCTIFSHFHSSRMVLIEFIYCLIFLMKTPCIVILLIMHEIFCHCFNKKYSNCYRYEQQEMIHT